MTSGVQSINHASAGPAVKPAASDGRISGGRKIGGRINSHYFIRNPRLSPAELQSEIDAYDEALAFVDGEIAKLMEELQRRGRSDNTLLIITSDHGESFSEHGLFLHGNSLYLETLHVPLIFHLSKHIPPRRLAEPVSTQSVPVTVMGIVAQSDSTFPGESLARVWNGENTGASQAAVIAEIERQSSELHSRPAQHGWIKSVINSQWQLIISQNGRRELYDIQSDRGGLKNLAEVPENRETLSQLEMHLQKLRASRVADQQ